MTAPSFSSATSPAPDKLIAGEAPRLTEDVTILTGQSLVAGSVIGEQAVSTVPATGTADGGNTGDGTMGSVTGGADTKPGIYTARCYKAAADAGDFQVFDPDGELVGIATVAVAFTSTHLNFTIADGAADFVVGDQFTVTVTGSGKYKLAAAAAVDGSQRPTRILAEAVDATSADKVGVAYMTGEFAEDSLTYGSGHTKTTVKDDLEALGIYLRPTLTV